MPVSIRIGADTRKKVMVSEYQVMCDDRRLAGGSFGQAAETTLATEEIVDSLG